MENVLYAFLWFLALGGILGFVLAFLSKKLHVEEDARKERILELLPGANCGGCSFAGCAAFADALLAGKAHPSSCGGLEGEKQEEICALLGMESRITEKTVARVMCSGGDRAKEKYVYEGIRDCRIAARLAGGNKMCKNGCTGLGNCERACPYHAITVKDGVAVVDAKLCRGCCACVAACPKGLIRMVPASCAFGVQCASVHKGAFVMKVCEVGCIGCKKCEKVCEEKAVTVENFVAVIDPTKCTSCGACAKVCPRGIIQSF